MTAGIANFDQLDSDWPRFTVWELQQQGILRVEDGNHGESRPRGDEFVEDGTAFIRAADLSEGDVQFNTASKISEQARNRITKGIGAGGDVIISHKGTVGKIGRAPADAPSFVCSPQTTFWRSTRYDVIDPDYLYVLMRSKQFLNRFSVTAGETDMAGYVSLTEQRRIEIIVPPLAIQKSIARVISPFDEKISLNQRANRTLEAMAEATFNDCFVDFGPTHAKMEGREPYLTTNMWALFPHRMGEGQIPEGWARGRLDDLFVLQRGFDLPADKRTDGQYPVIAAGGFNGFHDVSMVHGPGVVTGRSGVLGNVFYIDGDFWPLNTTLWVRDFKIATPLYAYFLLRNLDVSSFNAGSAVPSLNRNHIHNLPTIIPDPSIISLFQNFAEPLLRKVQQGHEEIKTLMSVHDLLLPKLLAGEVQLRHAVRLSEAVI